MSSSSFLGLKQQGEAEGIVPGRAETFPAGNYTLQLLSVKPGKTKAGDSSLALLWKSSDGRTAFQNLNFIPGNAYGNACTIQSLEEIGITTDFLARVETSQGLDPFAPELLRVSQGVWYHTEVTVRDSESGGKKYKNNDFYIKGRDGTAPGVATQYIPQQQAAPAPTAPAPAPAPQAPVPQPAPVPAPVPQPAGIPQAVTTPVAADPATGFPPRPGV